MSAIDSDSRLSRQFTPYQVEWILNDETMRLREKSVRIGWTYGDAFKNVRKRLHHKKRDYLFTTKDEMTAIEYVSTCHQFVGIYNLGKTIVSHGIEQLKVPRFDEGGRDTGFTDEIKVGLIKFDNGSRIIAFSSNPNALRAFGGDVGWDEAAFHPAPEKLWASAAGRVTWGYDIGVWSSHNGPDTLFNQFVREAKAGRGGWDYKRVDIYEAIKQGLVEKINEVRGTNQTREEFLQGCRDRARLPEIFAQEYECNPQGGNAPIVAWTVIEACALDYEIEREHLPHESVLQLFGTFDDNEASKARRAKKVHEWLMRGFAKVLTTTRRHRLGFDVAASGQGDLASIYIDSIEGSQAILRALLTLRTEDWEVMTQCVRFFMSHLSDIKGCGDKTGLGRETCWRMEGAFPNRFEGVDFGREKGDMGIALMNKLTQLEKRFPKAEPNNDIAADYYAIHKSIAGGKVTFSASRNAFNPASHCDIAWSGALADRADRVKGVAVSLTLC